MPVRVLVVNPGGPGFPATAFAASAAQFLPDEILPRFDLVGFEPRQQRVEEDDPFGLAEAREIGVAMRGAL